MAKITLRTILSGFLSNTQISANFDDIMSEFQNRVLYRDNPQGEPNTMQNDLDMNSNRILNLGAPGTVNEPVRVADLPAGTTSTNASLVTTTPEPHGWWSTVQGFIDYVYNLFIRDVNTYADLRGITITNTVKRYYVRARTTEGDGGHGFFRTVYSVVPGTYVENGGTVLLPTGGDGSTAFIRESVMPADPRWWGADSTGATDSYAAIQAAINSLPVVTAVDTDTGAGTANYTIHGGGSVLIDYPYKISNKLVLPPRVSLVGKGRLIADNTAVWTQASFDIVDRVQVDNGGAGYANSFTVTLTGGGFTTQATAKAYAVGGVIQFIEVTHNGQGYTSAPTVDLTAGGGAGGIATAYLKEAAKPLVGCAAPIYATYAPEIRGISMDCNGVADGVEWNVAKASYMEGVTIFNPLYDGIRYISADTGGTKDCAVYSAGHYGVYGLANTTSGCNEIEHVGLQVKYAGKANVKTTKTLNGCNLWRFRGGTVAVADSGAHEFELGASNTGHDLQGVKVEHEGGNSAAVVMITSGTGYNIDLIMAPRAPTIHYKIVHNAAGTSVDVGLTCVTTVLDSRVDNAVLANDISPFQSDVANGIRLYRTPHVTSAKLSGGDDWCRDQAGTNQMSTNFNMVSFGKGISQGMRTEKLDLEVATSATVARRVYVANDTVARIAEVASGETRFGTGAATADVYTNIRNNVSTVDATVTTIAAKGLTAGQTMVWEALVSAKGTGANAGYKVAVSAYHDGVNAVILGAATAVHTGEQNAAMNCTFTVSGSTVLLRVTGLAATNIAWTSFSNYILQ